MNRKIIFSIVIIIIFILNIVLDKNINNYIQIINECFQENIILSDFYYTVICSIIAFISVLIIIAMKLIIFYKK